jgi:uncharacterized OsmC-like protein
MKTIDAMKEDSELAQARFRLSNKWISGGHNQSIVDGFYGAKQELRHASTFKLDADEPAVLAGTDKGANPVEHLLNALAACVTTSMVYHAAGRGIAIEALESELEGDIDLRGFLGISDTVRKGFQNIRITFRIKTREPVDTVLLKELTTFSPVLDVASNGTPIDIAIETK